MPRPKIRRFCRFRPCACYFKPRGIPLRYLEEVILAQDELEALKLHDVDCLEQIEAAKKMKISQPTFARILNAAHRKVADAVVNGKAVRLEKGSEKT